MTEAHPPPAPGGHRIKLRYMTQVKTRPPGFMIKCSRPDELPESYKRYLVNGLRDHFDMPGTPIRSVPAQPGRRRTRGRIASSTRQSRLRKHMDGKAGRTASAANDTLKVVVMKRFSALGRPANSRASAGGAPSRCG